MTYKFMRNLLYFDYMHALSSSVYMSLNFMNFFYTALQFLIHSDIYRYHCHS